MATFSNTDIKVYDLPSARLAARLDNKLLKPNYNGSGDFRVAALCGIVRSDPLKWRSEFAEHAYVFPELIAIKERLNSVKNQLNDFRVSDALSKKYSLITDLIRLHDDLRGYDGVLVKSFNAEVVTNAWLKMYELCAFDKHTMIRKSKSRSETGREYKTFHFAEAPGNFLLAINHFIRNNYPNVNWTWLANSYTDPIFDRSSNLDFSEKPTNTKNQKTATKNQKTATKNQKTATKNQKKQAFKKNADYKFLGDSYGLMRNHPAKWKYGAENDGDISRPDNIRSFGITSHLMDKKGFDMVTSDVKYIPQGPENFDEEEMVNIPVHFGHVLCSLITLAKGGTAILKQFTYFEAPSVSILYLLCGCFEKVQIVKPITSRPANSETYVVCTGYKKNISKSRMNHLLRIADYIHDLNTVPLGCPSLFIKDEIPQTFIDRIIEINNELANMQIEDINRNIRLFNQFQFEPIDKIKRIFAASRKAAADSWISSTSIKPLDSNFHISDPHRVSGRHS